MADNQKRANAPIDAEACSKEVAEAAKQGLGRVRCLSMLKGCRAVIVHCQKTSRVSIEMVRGGDSSSNRAPLASTLYRGARRGLCPAMSLTMLRDPSCAMSQKVMLPTAESPLLQVLLQPPGA